MDIARPDSGRQDWRLSPEASRPILIFLLTIALIIAIASFVNASSLTATTIVTIALSSFGAIGLYAFLLRISGQNIVAALLLPLIFITLPYWPFATYPLYAIAVIGLVMINPMIRPKWDDALAIVLMVAIAFETEFLTGYYLKDLLEAGLENKDTLFHSAIAASYAHYLIPSVALDGLIPVQYHVLSHRIIGGYSVFSQLPVLEVYSFSFTTFAPVALVFAMANFANAIVPAMRFERALKRVAAVLLLIMLAFIFKRAAFSHSILASESFLIAEVFILLSLSGLWRWLDSGKTDQKLLFAAFAFLCLAGMSKASLAVLGLGIFGLIGLLFARNIVYWGLIFLATGLLYYALSGAAGVSASGSLIDPLKFIDTYSMSPKTDTMLTKTVLFLILHFLAVWLAIIAGIYSEGRRYLWSRECAALFAVTGPALLISVFLNFPAGANAYFSMVPMVLGLCFLVIRWPLGDGKIHTLGKVKISTNQIASIVFTLVLLQVFRTHGHFYPQILGDIAKAKNPEIASLITQMQAFKATVPKETEVKIENFERLSSKLGCSAFFLAPALLERPVNGGVPTLADCEGVGDGYGLSEYRNAEKRGQALHFPISTLRLNP